LISVLMREPFYGSFFKDLPYYFKKRAFLEYLLLFYEIQSADKMMEGTVPVPPNRPCAYGIVMYYLFTWYRSLGGAEAAG